MREEASIEYIDITLLLDPNLTSRNACRTKIKEILGSITPEGEGFNEACKKLFGAEPRDLNSSHVFVFFYNLTRSAFFSQTDEELQGTIELIKEITIKKLPVHLPSLKIDNGHSPLFAGLTSEIIMLEEKPKLCFPRTNNRETIPAYLNLLKELFETITLNETDIKLLNALNSTLSPEMKKEWGVSNFWCIKQIIDNANQTFKPENQTTNDSNNLFSPTYQVFSLMKGLRLIAQGSEEHEINFAKLSMYDLAKKLSDPVFAQEFFDLLGHINQTKIPDETHSLIFNYCKEKLRIHLNTYLESYKNHTDLLATIVQPNTMLGALIDHQSGFIKTKVTTTRKKINEIINPVSKEKKKPVNKTPHHQSGITALSLAHCRFLGMTPSTITSTKEADEKILQKF